MVTPGAGTFFRLHVCAYGYSIAAGLHRLTAEGRIVLRYTLIKCVERTVRHQNRDFLYLVGICCRVG